ncbi:hypothetical protein SAMN04515617_10319 [Collimonas sp. OK242]|jgi:hypothetical protein|uniref:hypothetical protein n=1 Tax=Collimonas sp. OK242 TaxID=1798195 RepID=UPI0008999230|nr:hypothetical protein [Collimonas sp. OK242]SDX33392.1 hypothetical protein SAMN04515617_10319 [Collimonas sp. OK242]
MQSIKNTEDVGEYVKSANRLLDVIMIQLGLKNDAALSLCLKVTPPVISKIRHSRTAVGASLLITLHEISNLSIAELKGGLNSSALCEDGNA